MGDSMILTYAIATHNRRDTLLKTLRHLHAHTPLPHGQWETYVVDNASTDQTASAIRQQFPAVRLIENPTNAGPVAKNLAFDQAAGKYIVILDDDSYPLNAFAVTRAIDHMERNPNTAVVVGRCELPTGRCEAPALPGVLMGGASMLRASVLRQVGGFPQEFFKGAEEYDLSFRIWDEGYNIDRLEDVVFRHDKVQDARQVGLLDFTDLRNNLILVERFLPRAMRSIYRRDWLRRYHALAGANPAAIAPAIAEARQWAARQRAAGRHILKDATLESIFHWRRQADAVAAWASAHNIRNVAIAGYSKNLYATYRACLQSNLEIQAIVDDAPPFVGQRYHGHHVDTRAQTNWNAIDGVVLSKINPAQIDHAESQINASFTGPILRLWHERQSTHPAPSNRIIPSIKINNTQIASVTQSGRGAVDG